MTRGEKLLLAFDRTAALFLGLAVGGAIGTSFVGGDAGAGALASTPTHASAAVPEVPAQAASIARAGPRLLRTAASGGTVHVGVFGDSFGDGVWAGLYHQLPDEEGIQVHKLSRQATGFTRYRATDLLEDTSERLRRQPVDIAVLSFGANDTQGIYHEGRGAEYMSERWQRIVGERVAAVVGLLRRHGAMVYWVGLPTMREPAYDAQIRRMNAFYAERMRALGVPFVDTAAMTRAPDGRYAPFLADPETGERFAARVNDGIHMTIPGYLLLTRQLSAEIRRAIGEARAENGRDAPAGAGSRRTAR